MSKNPDIKVLHAEYRGAMLEHNEKKAYQILRRIVEEDPNDSTARVQYESLGRKLADRLVAELAQKTEKGEVQKALAELEGLFPPDVLNKCDNYLKIKGESSGASERKRDTRTKELYRRLREALLSRKREEAFDLLEQICNVNPTDGDAQKQKLETGALLSSQYADEMNRLARAGEIQLLCDLMDHMRRWANPSLLSRLDGYRAAAALVDNYRRKQAEKEIARRLSDLRANVGASAKKRYDEVCGIGQLAAKYGISLKEEDRVVISAVKEVWDKQECERVRTEKLEELIGRFNDVMVMLKPIEAATDQLISEQLPDLEEVNRELEDLGDQPGAKEALTKVRHIVKRLRGILHRRALKKKVRTRAKKIIVSVTIVVIGLFCYAYASLESAVSELEKDYAAKNVEKLRKLTMSPSIISRAEQMIDTNYRVLFEKCRSYVARFDFLKSKVKKYTEQMRELSKDLDFSKEKECTSVCISATIVREELKKKYNHSLLPETMRVWEDFMDAVSHVRSETISRALAKYMSPPKTASIEELAALYTEYKEEASTLGFSRDQCLEIHKAFRNTVREILLYMNQPGLPTQENMRHSMEMFNKYVEPLELDRGLQEEIANLQRILVELNQIDKILSKNVSLENYIKTLDSFSVIYDKIPDVYHYEFLNQMSERQLSDIAMEGAARSCGAIPRKRELNRALYLTIAEIFKEGKNVYLVYHSSIGQVIDTLTKDAPNSNIWRENMDAVIYEGNVYPFSSKSESEDQVIAKLLNESGEDAGQKEFPAGRVQIKKYKFAGLGDELGIKRLLLQRGEVLPVDLLRRIANKYKDTQCPLLALAWFFKETIELLESYPEPLANGIAFSPSLQKDIREFRVLERQMNLKKGCWLLPHKEKHEKTLRDFFARVAARDYQGEIDRRIKYILDAKLALAGFVSENDRLVVLPNMMNRPLYILSWNDQKKAVLTPYREHMRLQRFTPVFSIDPMDPFPSNAGKTTQTQKVSKQVEPIPSLFPDEETGAADDGVSHELSGKQLKIHEVLDIVRIERVNFEKALISDVAALLSGELRKNSILSLEVSYQKPRKVTKELDATEPEVTGSFSDVTLRELLIGVCAIANCVYVVKDDGIFIYKKGDPASKLCSFFDTSEAYLSPLF